ncbi:hypothetical protein [Pseudoalteromonas sp. GutCa3]|uniref:hypothetical protein n=1 Tax=Pseudoalteromonas sp. GutCa3 TaxID=888433 RepID=UPI000C34B586|nr:hypothetical protein [Pseudoalteromonas sp. GutCa3]PKG68616.1 hypothetical protein CXF64_20045 [Pseudoalteromonas sp. GutCa3]
MFKVLLSVFSVAVIVSGCTSSISSFDTVKREGEIKVEEAYEFAIKDKKYPHVSYSDDYFVPKLKAREQDMPNWFFDKSEGSYLDYTLEEVMRDELARRGVNIRYLDNLDKARRFSIVHRGGSIGGLLDKISFATKYSYEIEGDLLTWSKFKTEEFDVSFIAGQTNYMFGNKNGGSSSDSNTNSSGAVTTDAGFDNSDEFINFSTEGLSIWNDIEKSITLLKSDEGKFVINESTSTIMIKDFPDNVSAISSYLERENKKITKMVAVDLQIIEFTSNEGDQKGINWNVVKQDLATGGVFGLTTAFTSLVQDDLAPTLLGYNQSTGKYAGSNVLVNVLEQYGAVSVATKKRIVSLNNQVAKVIGGGELGYLAQSGGTATANVGTQDNLMPGILKTGETIYMLPNAVKDKIVIQLSTKISNLEELRTVTSGGKSIETPETSKTDLFLKFAVQDGETLLISGSSENRSEYKENSTGGLILLGGELGGNKGQKETIILITPRIVN